MPPDSHNEQELMLKKRARRRLVGAVALVLLMIILLPQVLQDRAVLAQQDPIKIVMQEPAPVAQPIAEAPEDNPAQTSVDISSEPVAMEPPKELSPEILTGESNNKSANSPTPTVAKVTEPKAIESKADIAKASSLSSVNSTLQTKEFFTVQVGVYSDAANVKRLQDQLKQAGYTTRTEKVKTDKGESIRLKAGSYQSRDAATAALEKIKSLGLPGIVVSQQAQ